MITRERCLNVEVVEVELLLAALEEDIKAMRVRHHNARLQLLGLNHNHAVRVKYSK